jgi:hypothetical protein
MSKLNILFNKVTKCVKFSLGSSYKAAAVSINSKPNLLHVILAFHELLCECHSAVDAFHSTSLSNGWKDGDFSTSSSV